MKKFNLLFVNVASLLYCCVYIFPEVVAYPFVANLVKKNGEVTKKSNQHATPKFKFKSISKSEFEENLEPLPDDPSEDNGESGAVETPDKDSSAVARSLSIETLLNERWSLETPSINKDMAFDQSYTFSMKFDKLQLNLIGSMGAGCTVKIKCSSKNLPANPDYFIQITDGLGGQIIYSESKKFRGYRKPSENGTDIYVRYKGKNPFTMCTARCMNKTDRFIRKLPNAASFVSSIDTSCKCGDVGKRTVQGRIIGGEEATPFEIPWQIALVKPGTRDSVCGASLINERYALTAAHCFDNSTYPEYEVLLHAHVLNQVRQPGTNVYTPYNESTKKTDADEKSLRLKVEETIIHQLYPDGLIASEVWLELLRPSYHHASCVVSSSLFQDLALLRFTEKIDFAQLPHIKPICLESLDAPRDYSGQMASVSGWGQLKENKRQLSSTLQKVSIKMFSREVCGLTPVLICGGFLEGGKDACQGDSGGPLSIKNNNKWRQIGVVSLGEGCAEANAPGYYGKVGEMRQWIQRMVHHDTKWCQE